MVRSLIAKSFFCSNCQTKNKSIFSIVVNNKPSSENYKFVYKAHKTSASDRELIFQKAVAPSKTLVDTAKLKANLNIVGKRFSKRWRQTENRTKLHHLFHIFKNDNHNFSYNFFAPKFDLSKIPIHYLLWTQHHDLHWLIQHPWQRFTRHNRESSRTKPFAMSHCSLCALYELSPQLLSANEIF